MQLIKYITIPRIAAGFTALVLGVGVVSVFSVALSEPPKPLTVERFMDSHASPRSQPVAMSREEMIAFLLSDVASEHQGDARLFLEHMSDEMLAEGVIDLQKLLEEREQ